MIKLQVIDLQTEQQVIVNNVISLRRDYQKTRGVCDLKSRALMNRFGEIADELSELIEELETAPLDHDAIALCRALQRAFVQACLAEQAMRRREEIGADAALSAP